MKQVFYLKDDPVQVEFNPIIWFTYPNGQRTVSKELVKLIELFYFPN